MITNRLKIIILSSIPVFIIHGIEEYINHFYEFDPVFSNVAQQFFKTIPEASFMSFQITWWILLIIAFLLLSGRRGIKIVLFLLGLAFFYELIHLLSTVLLWRYTPGFYTSLLFPFLAFFYWKELLRNLKVK